MKLTDMLLAVMVAALWGGNYVSSKIGVGYFPPFFFCALRFLLVGMLLVPFTARPAMKQIMHIATIGFVLNTLHIGVLVAALAMGLDIATCVVIIQFGVPFSCLLGVLMFHERIGWRRISGIVVAFIGIIIVVDRPDLMAHPLASAIALFAAGAWAVSNIMLKKIEGIATFQMLGWMSLMSVPPLLIISLLCESHQLTLLQEVPLSAALAVLYTGGCSTILAYGAWYHLMHKFPVSQIVPFSLLVPLSGIAFGQLFFNEPLSMQMLIGGAITIAGVAVIVMRKPKAATLAEAT